MKPEPSTRGGWTTVIGPPSGWADVNFGELWRYRDLVLLLVRRDVVATYSQTILGPIWFVIQPVLTTVIFTLIFNRVARLPTDGLPPSLFYMAGVVAWGFFATCVTKTSDTFLANTHVFGKVWFPRLSVPVATVLSALPALGIQLVLLAVMLGVVVVRGLAGGPDWSVILLPLLVVQLGALALGVGTIVAAMTTRYRDLKHLVGFGVQLWMFATPVVYPASRIPKRWEWLMYVNPMAPVIEASRRVILGVGSVSAAQLATSVAITCAVLAVGLALFARVERSVMDGV